MFEERNNLLKNATRHINQADKSKVEDFKSTLNDLFDIAYQDALKNINEDTQFLLLQRKKGCFGCMAGVDLKILWAEERRVQRKATKMIRLEKSKLKFLGSLN